MTTISPVAEPPMAPPQSAPPGPAQGTTRRSFLRRAGLAGGTAVVVSAGGLSYRAYDRGVFEAGKGGAYDAWGDWEKGRGPLALVSAAVLAANPHDYQAWVFRTTPSRVDVFADRKRALGTIDPFDREMYVGLGCALENLLQAAPAHGYRAKLTLLPSPGRPVHAARIDLKPGQRRRGALYGAIPERRTDRSAYEAKRLSPGLLTQMTALAGGLPGARLHWFDGKADRAQIGGLMVDAALAITRDDQQSRDGFRLFRPSWDDIQKHKDGLTLDAQGLSALTTAVAKLLPASDRKSGDKFWVDQTRKTHTETAAAYGIIAVPDADDNAHRLTGGRLLERVHLWATANGVALHHMNQMTERADRERQLRLPPRFGRAVQALIPDGGGQPLVAFRVGYAKGKGRPAQEPAAPRHECGGMSTAVSSAAMPHDGRLRTGRRSDRLAGHLALAGASLGVVAGLLELAIGPSVRDWVGNKQDTTRLGLTTLVLSAVAALAAAALRRPRSDAGGRRVAIALALVIPALVCFTTVGRLWYLPGALLLGGGALVLAGTRRGDFAAALDGQHWRVGLLAVCGAYYVLLGATALGLAGVLGILGGVSIWTAARVAPHSPRAAYAFLVSGALPFAAATWWSVITPVLAVLAVVIGVGVIHHADPSARTRQPQ